MFAPLAGTPVFKTEAGLTLRSAADRGERAALLPVAEEAEWRDDPAALADWEAWMKTIEPLELTPEEQAAGARFDEEFRRFNVEAVRRQLAEGDAG